MIYDCLDKPIKSEKLILKPEWDIKILDWVKENKIKSPKIGWWLLTSYI